MTSSDMAKFTPTQQINSTSTLELRVIFPVGRFTSRVLEVPEPQHGSGQQFCALEILLEDGAFVEVDGFGLPYHNPGHIADDWLNKGSIVANSMTFIDILRQRKWHIIVGEDYSCFEQRWRHSLRPATFSFPYGESHHFDLVRYEEDFKRGISRGFQFPVSMSFPDVPSMQAALAQSAIQDCLWIAFEVARMFANKLRAYFVPVDKDAAVHSQYYAIVEMGVRYRQSIQRVWSRVAKDGFLRLAVHRNMSPMTAPRLVDYQTWNKYAVHLLDAEIMEMPHKIPELSQHQVSESYLVLLVHDSRYAGSSGSKKAKKNSTQSGKSDPIELATFSARSLANRGLPSWNAVSLLFDSGLSDLERKVESVNQYALPAAPSNIGGWRLSKGRIPGELQRRMEMHTSLQLGRGLSTLWRLAARSMTDPNSLTAICDGVAAINVDEKLSAVEWRLPEVNILDVNVRMVKCLMEEVLEQDRGRFRQYMSHLPLGFGIITAGAGFGKTSALAIATLGMAHTVKKVYVSAPTHVAVDNFARRLDMLDQRIVERYNRSKRRGRGPVCRRVIIRGYAIPDEIEAFLSILQDAESGATPAKKRTRRASKWKLHLSVAYWLLRALGSPAVPALEEDDSKGMRDLRDKLEKDPVFAPLADVAAGRLPWAEYQGPRSEEELAGLFARVIKGADLVCSTPALSNKAPYSGWKRSCARGIAVDEAATMGRPDLYCVWGNTLLPCLLGGDDKQLLPAVMTTWDKDDNGRYLNRHVEDGKLSALAFYKANSWPIYRLHTQFRMARGMFGLCHEMFYSDVSFEYAPGCDPSLDSHADGAKLEAFLQQRFPSLSPPEPGTLEPVFVHCRDTRTWRNPLTGSKWNLEQCEVALRLLVDLVKVAGIDASHIGVIAPYKANVAIMERWLRERSEYAVLREVAPPATVDSYQGQEADIVCVVLGTTRESGPGFTSNANRLNVMLSRQKSGLVVVGDIELAGFERAMDGGRNIQGVGEPDCSSLACRGPGGHGRLAHESLRKVYRRFKSKGRVATAG